MALSGRGDHFHVDALDGDGIPGLHNGARTFCPERHVGLVPGLGIRVDGSKDSPVIEKGANGQLGGKLRHAPDVISMVVRDHQVIDLLHARRFSRGDNAIGVTVVEVAVARIHQHGFARWRNVQGGLAPFHIDGVDPEVVGRRQQRSESEKQNACDPCGVKTGYHIPDCSGLG